VTDEGRVAMTRQLEERESRRSRSTQWSTVTCS
jgi:hypothetical protein